MTAKVKGLNRTLRTLGKVEVKLQRRILRQAITAAAKPVLNDARSHVPVDSGELHDSLRITARVRKNEHMASARVRAVGVPYANYVEFGTSVQSGDPFMRISLDANEEEVPASLAREIRKRLPVTVR